MRKLATIFGALALMTWGVSAQEGSAPATVIDAQPAAAAPAMAPAAEALPVADLEPAVPAAASQEAPEASAEPKTAPLSAVEVVLFCVVVVGVIALGIWKSRDPEETAEEKRPRELQTTSWPGAA